MYILGPTSPSHYAKFEVRGNLIKEYNSTNHRGVELPAGILSNGYNIGRWEDGKFYAVDPYDINGRGKAVTLMVGQVTNWGH